MTSPATETQVQERLLRSCPVLADMLATGVTVSMTGEEIPAAGLTTIRNLVVLRRLMEVNDCKDTLEVGLAHGGSTLAIAAAHRDLGHAPQHQHIAIDPYQRGYPQGAGLAAVERAGLAPYVEHVAEFSQHALPALHRAGRNFDLIFVDGSHSFDDVFVDFYFCDRLLAHHGHLIFDDCSDHRVRKVTNFILRNYDDAYTEVRLEELFMPRNRLRLAAGRWLGRNQVRVFQRTTDEKRSWDSPMRSF